MASLKDLRRRIRATKSMQQIFKAMEMVSAAKLRRAQSRAAAAGPYSKKITDMLANLSGAAAELEHPLFKGREVRHTALVLVTADRGFAGTYSVNVLRAAEHRIQSAPPGSVRCLVLGRKGRDYLRRRGYPVIAAHTELPGEASLELARRLTAELTGLFLSGEFDRVEIMYTHFVNALVRKIRTEVFLPVHQVTLAPYCVDTFEVTAAQYNACRDRGGCKKATFNAWPGLGDKDRAIYDPLCNGAAAARATHPINCVAWEMADHYCKQEGGRLPTEAEWEVAARGPDGRKYPWGDEPPAKDLLNACGTECTAWGAAHGVKLAPPMYKEDDRFPNTAPVGSFPKGKSRYGVADVVGNVWEWVSDYYAPYEKENATNPTGPGAGAERVVRGGAWNGTQPSWVRPTFRFKDDPETRSFGIGFRCARSL